MKRFTLRLPQSLHKQVRKVAAQENVSINQLITLTLAEKISALLTEEYLQARETRQPQKVRARNEKGSTRCTCGI